MSDRPRFRFSLRAMLWVTTIFAVAVAVVSYSAFSCLLTLILLPVVVRLAMRVGDRWIPRDFRTRVAVGLFLGGMAGMLLIGSLKFKLLFSHPIENLLGCTVFWAMPFFVIGKRTRRR